MQIAAFRNCLVLINQAGVCKSMKKQVLFLLLFAAVVGIMPSCQKDPKPLDEGEKDEKPMTPREREIYKVLESAGTLSNEIPAKYDNKPVEKEPPRKEYAVQGNQSGTRITEKKHCAFGDSNNEFALLNPWAGVLWPGALIQGGSLRGKAVPSSVPLREKRKPGRLILQVVGGNGKLGDEKWYKECPMRESEVIQAQNELIRQFLTSKTHADYTISVSSVYSREDLKVKAGVHLKGFGGQLDAAFAGSWNEEKSHVLVKIVQKFFTISYEDPDGGFRGVFTDDVTQQELAPYTGNGNPICYVSSVSYGRVYYLLIESSEDSRDIEVCAAASYGERANVDGALKQSEVLKNSKITVCQYGGNAAEGMKTTMQYSHEELLKFLDEGSEFGPDNVGAPISFTVKHLYDNSPVHMVNTLEYDYTQTTFVPDNANNLYLIIDDITFEGTFSDSDYEFDGGEYSVTNLSLEIKKTTRDGKDSIIKRNDSITKDLMPLVGDKQSLRHRAIFCVKGKYFDDHMSDVHHITISAKVHISSIVSWTFAFVKVKTISENTDLSFTIPIGKDNKGAWRDESSDGNCEKFRSQTQRVEFEKVGYKVTLSYRFYINNLIVQSDENKSSSFGRR